MKLNYLFWMLLFNIPSTLFAQKSLKLGGATPSASENLKMTYYKELKMGNTFKLEMYGTRHVLPELNIDSLLREIIRALHSVKDSLPNEITGRKFMMEVYNVQTREINIIGTAASSKSFVEYNGERSQLKTAQDSIVLNLHTKNDPLNKTKTFYRLSFFINDLFDIEQYATINLSNAFKNADADNYDLWKHNRNGSAYLKSDPSITLFKSYDPMKRTLGMIANISVSLQNYSKTIVPSIGLGIGFQKQYNYKVTTYWLSAEPHFTFGKNEKGQNKAHLSPFVVLRYRQYHIDKPSQSFLQGIYQNFSVGYLLRDNGGKIAPNTFKIGFTEVYLGRRSLRLEPLIYFNNFFKNVLPGIRLTQSF